MESVLISSKWYTESPIDFEHKQYVLLDYLLKVDNSFREKVLSPHLLYMEKMLSDLYTFNNSYYAIKKNFNKNRYLFFDNEKLDGEENEYVEIVKEIVDFSIPQILVRVDLGKSILKKNKQILY